MSLAPGTRLGPFEVVSGLGAGGMGEVYRATDLNLKRQVAIKVLPGSLARGEEQLARFQREAEVLAALNHPHIAQIYGLEKSDGAIALAMELVEGPTLADLIATGAVPSDQAAAIARQIIDALAAAHGQGIVHRDLKPANIKVRPDGTVKVLDFGLAKAMSPPGVAATPDPSMSPTLSSPMAMTQMGMVLGTPAYMAPEQARGRAVDARADVWAFGCVLFEMLSGQRPFDGDSVADVVAQVLERDPDWSTLPKTTAPAIRRLLRRCLEKNPTRRLAAIADARWELDEAEAVAPGHDTVAAAPAARSGSVLQLLVGLLTLALAVSGWGWWRAVRPGREPYPSAAAYVATTMSIAGVDLRAHTDRFAVSPDGLTLVIADPARGLLLRKRGGLDVAPIPGAPAGSFSPVFSPDGRWVAFGSDQGLMKIPVEGGSPTLLVAGGGTQSDYFISLTWSDDGRIRYPSLYNDAIREVSADGGRVETIAMPNAWVSRAVGLTNGRLLVSMLTNGAEQIVVRESDGTMRKVLDGWDARPASAGQLLFSRRDGTSWSIMTAPFDPSSGSVTGSATALATNVPVRYVTPAGAGANGDVFYVANPPRSDRRLVIADRTGAERDIPLPAAAWVSQRLSPDGTNVALGRWEGAGRTIWTLARETGALTQITYSDDMFSPRWMPDGTRLVFAQFPLANVARSTSIWSVPIDGTGKLVPIPAQWDAYPGDVTSDGTLYYEANHSDQTQLDLLAVALGRSDAKPVSVLATRASEDVPTPSPDGRWLAYRTNASGNGETRVMPVGNLAASIQVSTKGGRPIRWSRDGARVYYVDGDTVCAVDVGAKGPVLSSRRTLFTVPKDLQANVDVTPDGEHLTMIRGGLIYSDIIVLQGALPH